jgi:hypothetical protein
MDNNLVENAFIVDIKYKFEFEDGKTKTFDTNVDLTSKEIKSYSKKNFKWTELDFHKCGHCTLNSKDYPFCPAALSISDIVEYFSVHSNYPEAKCTVILPEKNVAVEKPLSEILSSLMGLRLATSRCPFLSELKMMARFHEPFASPFYTVFRSTSAYLLKQYFLFNDGKKPDLNFIGLKHIYETLSISNQRMQDRLNDVSGSKCHPCSMSALSVLTVTMTLLFDEHLAILKELEQS